MGDCHLLVRMVTLVMTKHALDNAASPTKREMQLIVYWAFAGTV